MRTLILITLFFISLQSYSEETDKQIIKEIQKIANESELKEILPVEGYLNVDSDILFLETLKFEDGATLRLKAGNRKAIYLIAKEVRVHGGEFKANIEYLDRQPHHGLDGLKPPQKLPQVRRGGGHGNDGVDGLDGENGVDGKTRSLPTLYIVTPSIVKISTYGEAKTYPDLRINVSGINGGDGGDGGDGQAGQDGQHGRHGKCRWGVCSAGPRNGGDGGDGGKYGVGGKGANGGDGGDVVFVITPELAEFVKSMRINISEGAPGIGGLNGKPGVGGNKGDRGSRPCNCTGGYEGAYGKEGAFADIKRSESGDHRGRIGRIRYVEFKDLNEIFK